ncbi:acetolactate synthase [Rhodobacteraceae bacterium ASV31]|nr:acetolactate synthase [Anianabacter salinae]
MAAPPVGAQAVDAPIPVPSGQAVTFLDVVTDERGPSGLTYRFRFVAPGIGKDVGAVDFAMAAADLDHLCREYALPRLSSVGPQPSQIVITLADRPIEFGVADPSVTQFFEAYRPENGDCIWEGF